MRYAVLGLAIAVGLFGWIVYSGEVANAGGETRLRAFLSTPDVDPFRLNGADFRQRSDGTRFSAEVHNVAELGTGRVVVMRTSGALLPVIILEAPIAIVLDPLRGTGVGHLEMDSRLGDLVPIMAVGDTVEVWNALGQLIRMGMLGDRR